jgi:hypothetical protein
MTKEQCEVMKKIKEVEGKILTKICENYSAKIQLAIDKLIKERESLARCHYQMYQRAFDSIKAYEDTLFDAAVKNEIAELTRC